VLPSEAGRDRTARRTCGAAAACLLVSIVVAVSAVRQSGGWGRNALFALELGALLGFWLACLSCLLRRSGPALVLVWTTVLSGLVVTALISAGY